MEKKFNDVLAVVTIEENKKDSSKQIMKFWEYYNNGYSVERRAKRFFDNEKDDNYYHLIGFSRKDGKFNVVKSLPNDV